MPFRAQSIVFYDLMISPTRIRGGWFISYDLIYLILELDQPSKYRSYLKLKHRAYLFVIDRFLLLKMKRSMYRRVGEHLYIAQKEKQITSHIKMVIYVAGLVRRMNPHIHHSIWAATYGWLLLLFVEFNQNSFCNKEPN